MKQLRHFVILSIVSLGCMNCNECDGPEATAGEQGRALFAWEAPFCTFDCNAEAPMAASASARLRVTNVDALPEFRAESDDEDLAVAFRDGDSVQLMSQRAGLVRVLLIDVETDSLVDSLPVEMAEVASLAAPALDLLPGGRGAVAVELFDADRRRLVGNQLLAYEPGCSLDRGQISVEVPCTATDGPFFSLECVAVEAAEVGVGCLEVEAPSGALLRVDVEVLPVERVTSVQLRADEPDDEGRVRVRAEALVDGEVVPGGRCLWGFPAGAASDAVILSEEALRAQVALPSVEAAELACTIGGISGRLQLDPLAP